MWQKFKYLGTTVTNQNDMLVIILLRIILLLLLASYLKTNIKMYMTIFVSVLLYECEILSHPKRRLRVFENSLLKRMFRSKREASGGQRKLYIGTRTREFVSNFSLET
jgi:hypothetical protein